MTQAESVRYTNSLNRIINFAQSVIKKPKTPIGLITEHRCPLCNRAVIEWAEIMYMNDIGYCLGCDNILGEKNENN